MEIDLFAGLAVTDYPRALEWYERFLGAPATFEAHETESVWELSGHRFVNVVLHPERAGHAMVVLFVDDLDGFVDAASARGIEPAQRETYGSGVRKVTYQDPDGNEVGLGGAPLAG